MKIYKKSLILGTSIIALSVFTLPLSVGAHENSATPHPPIIVSATCHATNNQGVASGAASSNDLCPLSTKPDPINCTPTFIDPDPVDERCCFIAGTKVSMADGTQKNIEDVVVGDKVLGYKDAVHTVSDHRIKTLADRTLIAINGSRPFATRDHTFKTADGWASADPKMTEERYPDVIADIGGRPDEMIVGTVLLARQGEVNVTSLEHSEAPSETPVYDLEVDGDHTYYADGYVVHNCGGDDGGGGGDGCCFFSGTKVLMDDGTLKAIETIEKGDVTAFGEVHQKLARHYDRAHQYNKQNGCILYKGVYVTGNHVSFTGEEWVEAHDLMDAIPSDPPRDEVQTFNLVTEGRIIPVMGNSGLLYFADNLNNVGSVSEYSLKMMQENNKKTA